MRATASCLTRGYLGRSLDEFSRLAKFVIKLEAMNPPTTPFMLRSMREPDCLEGLLKMSDRDIGGFSEAHIDWVPPVKTSDTPSPSMNPHGHLRFHGTISTKLPKNQAQRSGFAMFRTRDLGSTIWGKTYWDMDHYNWLALRVKSDGRKYFVNLQSETVVDTDIHQHRLFARRPGEWETVLINWNEFVRTNHGAVVEPQNELQKNKLKTIGLSLIDRVPGPFDICVERIWATNGLGEEELAEDNRGPHDLKRRKDKFV